MTDSDDTSRSPFIDDLTTLAFLQKVETALSLPEGTYKRLLREDDWSFVIKLHALFETAISHLLTENLKQPSLIDVFTRLEMSNVQSGKMAFVKSLELLDKPSQTFIQKLSELRNQFIHNARNVEMTLESFFAALPPSDQNGFLKTFKWGMKEPIQLDFEDKEARYKPVDILKSMAVAAFSQSPKVGIWLGALTIMLSISNELETCQYRKTREELDTKLISLMENLVEKQNQQ